MAGLKQGALALATAGLLWSGAAQAALFDRGGGLIYDSDRNITWLADANYAETSGHDADGLMGFNAANIWAANLVYHDSVRNVDYTDWRLPTALNQDGTGPCGPAGNCTGSEMGHLFYTEGGLTANQEIITSANLNQYFTNMQVHVYWSGTVREQLPAGYAWTFQTSNGFQGTSVQSGEWYAWAVRPGDVAAIPEPGTYALLLAGLGLLGVAAKRRRRSLGAS